MDKKYKELEKKYNELKKKYNELERRYDAASGVLEKIGSTWPSDLFSQCEKCNVYIDLDERYCVDCIESENE